MSNATNRTYPFHVTLPSGGWAQFRDPKQVTRGARRAYRLAQTHLDPQLRAELQKKNSNADMTAEWQEQMWAVQDALTCMYLSEWSYDQPVRIESLNELPDEDTDVVAQVATAIHTEQPWPPVEPAPDLNLVTEDELRASPGVAPTDFPDPEPSPDPASPTSPSGEQ